MPRQRFESFPKGLRQRVTSNDGEFLNQAVELLVDSELVCLKIVPIFDISQSRLTQLFVLLRVDLHIFASIMLFFITNFWNSSKDSQ